MFEYDGAGNITRIGADRFVYDPLSRVTEARLGEYPSTCDGPEDDLTLSFETETSPMTHEACGTIDAGPSYTIASEVTLRAGGRVALHDGFSVASGGSLAIETDAPLDDAPPGPVDRDQSFDYDRFGNLTGITTDGVLRTMTVDATTNRLSSGLASYDPAGNVTSQVIGAQIWGYDHDPFDMLRHVTTPEGNGYVHLYGPGDERAGVIDWSDGHQFTNWVETYTLRDLDASPLRQYRVDGGNGAGHWSIHRDYVWRGATLLAALRNVGLQVAPETTHFLHPDHLGSPRLITDETGNTVAQHVYFPFGEEATPPSTDEVLKFTGHERDPQGAGTTDDLDYMHARYYSAHLGRFVSVDPSGASRDLRRPQSWNRYAYALGNPLRYVDPDGQVWAPAYDDNQDVRTAVRMTLEEIPVVGGALAATADFFIADFFPVNHTEASAALDSMVMSYGAVLNPASKAAKIGTKLDNLFAKNLSRETIEAAARESAGEVVARKASGEAYDHIGPFIRGRRSAAKQLRALQSLVSAPGLTDAERTYVNYLLSKFSKKLDEAEDLFDRVLKKLAPE
ncbi:MAG: RHS repeat-associated core domain-containing protein [Acidobacteriota bacterium]